MKPYTVLLAYPTWCTAGNRAESYMAHVMANDPIHAIEEAFHQMQVDSVYPDSIEDVSAPFELEDLDEIIAVFEGHLQDLRYYTQSEQS